MVEVAYDGSRGFVVYYDSPDRGLAVYGKVKGSVLVRQMEDEDYHPLRDSIVLPENVLESAVDLGVETIVFVQASRRYVSSVEDWQDYGVAYHYGGEDYRTLARTYMGN